MFLFDNKVTKLKPEAFKEEMKGDFMLIDVRSPGEFRRNGIKGAINIPLNKMQNESKRLLKAKGKRVLVYCHSGIRTNKAAKILKANGFDQIYILSGGVLAWEKKFKK